MKKENKINIGAAIRTGRRRKGWKQKEFAKILDVSPSLVSSWETNTRIPSGDDLIEIANLLDIVDLLFPSYNIEHKNSEDNFIHSFILKEESIDYKVANLAQIVENLQNKVVMLEQKCKEK